MVQVVVIPAALSRPVAARELDGLDAFQAAVGGYIEALDLPDLGVTMLVDEEGLLRRLPFNRRATFLWWGHVPAVQGESVLVGDVVVVGATRPDGQFSDVPSDVVIEFTDRHPRQVQVRTRGDDEWHHHRATFGDHFTALGWAMMTLDRWENVVEVEVAPVPAHRHVSLQPA